MAVRKYKSHKKVTHKSLKRKPTRKSTRKPKRKSLKRKSTRKSLKRKSRRGRAYFGNVAGNGQGGMGPGYNGPTSFQNGYAPYFGAQEPFINMTEGLYPGGPAPSLAATGAATNYQNPQMVYMY